LRLKQPFIQPHSYSISIVFLSIALLFTHSAHAQSSNWWEQQKSTPPASAQRAIPAQQSKLVTTEENNHSAVSAQENTVDKLTDERTDTFSIPKTYYLEGGFSEIKLTDYGASANGSYLKLSLRPSQIHFLASYQNPAKDVSITEIGIGSISRHRFQLTSTLTTQLWEVGEVERSFIKSTIGLRTQFSPYFDMWVGVGYMWTNGYTDYYNYQGQFIGSDFVDTLVGNIGFQFLITSNFGIVFDVDTLNKLGIDFFRAGIRASF